MDIVTQIHMERLRQRITQEDLAKRAGVHEVTICRIERGKNRPSMDVLWKLASALNMSISLTPDDVAKEPRHD